MLRRQPDTSWTNFCHNYSFGCRHSSVDSSALSIMPPRVQLPSTPSMLLSFIVKFVLYLSLRCEKNENKPKRGRVWPIFLKNYSSAGCLLWTLTKAYTSLKYRFSRPHFVFFAFQQLTIKICSVNFFTDDWIWTTDLQNWEQLSYLQPLIV